VNLLSVPDEIPRVTVIARIIISMIETRSVPEETDAIRAIDQRSMKRVGISAEVALRDEWRF